MSDYDITTHLPGLRLDLSDRSLGPGLLRSLHFEQWQSIDNNFPFEETKYTQTRPLFLEFALSNDEASGFDEAFAHAEPIIRRLYQALLIATRARLHDPVFSVSYVRHGSAYEVHLGPFDREFLVFGDTGPTVSLTEDHLRRAERLHDLLECAPLVPEAEAAIATLSRTARPEFSPVAHLTHNVMALEALLIPELRSGLKAAFSARGAALLAIGLEDDLEWMRGLCRALYTVRSEALHGRDPWTNAYRETGYETDQLVAWARALLCLAVERLLSFGRAYGCTNHTASLLRAELVAAVSSGARMEALHETWTDESLDPG